MGRIIAVSTNKGGVLKSSLATNIAGVLSEQDIKVLIVDSDNQGNVALSFGLNPDKYETSLYDVMVNDNDINSAIVNVSTNIDIIVSNDDMSFLEFDILTNIKKYKNPFHLLRNQLLKIASNYQIIIVDTPPNLGLINGNVLAVANDVLIPFQPESYSMRSLIKIMASIRDFREKHNPELSVLGIVPTLVDSRTTLHTEVLQECRRYAYENDIKMFETVIPRSVRFANSVAYHGKPAVLTDKKNNLVQSYYQLVEEMGLKW